MIHDLTTSVPEDADVRILEASPFSFYLTGSHYFGCARPDSDIDFMVQNTEEVESWLRARGFKTIVGDKDYGPRPGSLTVKVLHKANVQVELSSHLALFRKCRDFIKANNAEWHKDATREERQWMWDTVATVLNPEHYCAVLF